jgi:hypothetical protein
MIVRATLTVDDVEIGDLIAFRMHPLDQPHDDDQCTYSWTLQAKGEPESTGLVEHRHGDGPWALIARIAQKAGHPDTP